MRLSRLGKLQGEGVAPPLAHWESGHWAGGCTRDLLWQPVSVAPLVL